MVVAGGIVSLAAYEGVGGSDVTLTPVIQATITRSGASLGAS